MGAVDRKLSFLMHKTASSSTLEDEHLSSFAALEDGREATFNSRK